jgi:hypothetical protein
MKRLVALGLVIALVLTLAIPAAVSADGGGVGVSGTVDAQPGPITISPTSGNSSETATTTVPVIITGTNFGPDAVVTTSDSGIAVGYTGSETSFYVNSTTLDATFTIPAGTTVLAGNKTITVNQGGRTPVTTSFKVNGWTDVTAPASFNMGVMAVGTTTEGSSIDANAGSIQTNDASWEVDAQDANTGTNSGYMIDSGTPLHSQLKIGSTTGPTSPANTGFAYKSSTQTGKSLPFYADQLISSADTSGTYSIIINFTGSAK